MVNKSNEDTTMKTSWNKGIPEREETKLKKAATFAAKRALINYTEKACKVCSETKSLELFPKKKDNKDGHHNVCKACENTRKAKYKWTREQFWEYEIKKQYGLTVDMYNSILADQNMSCAICNIHIDDYKGVYGKGKKVNNFTVDHCHTSGKVRGLTCFRCNLMLGYAQDNPTVLEKGAMYLKEKAHQSGLLTEQLTLKT
jgi:hypothetical protein